MRVWLAILILTNSAIAAPKKSPVTLTLKNRVKSGEKPSLTFTAQSPLKLAQLVIVRTDDNQAFRYDFDRIAVGVPIVIAIGDGKGGKAHWKGMLTVDDGRGNTYNNEVQFDSVAASELSVKYTRDRIHLDEHYLEFLPSRDIASASLRVTDEEGHVIGEGELTAPKGKTAAQWQRIDWHTSAPSPVFQLELKVLDADGAGTLVRLTPWSVNIPHEEINFATGKWDIDAKEEPKLKDALGRAHAVLDRVMKLDPTLDVRLFVAGHTDTIGDPTSNRALSLNRATAIANYLRGHGITIPVAVAGCGEDLLKVATADNTDEVRNRRADYILAAGAEGAPNLRGACKWVTLTAK